MDLTYSVPRDAYIDLLADMIRANDRRPLRRFTALLLTVGQMAVVLALCVVRLEGKARVFTLVWSLLLAGLTVLRRSTVRLRAGGTLQRLEYTGQLPEDYWKKHRLHTVGQNLLLSYGEQRLSCPMAAISTVEEHENALYLYCQKTIFDIVPLSAFKSREEMLRFADSVRALAAHAEEPAAPRTEENALTWRMSAEDFENGQYLAYRTLYYRYRFLRRATFVRFAISVAVAIGLVSNPSPLNLALGGVLLLLANLENLSMLPPLCRFRIRQELGAWRGGGEFRLSLVGDVLRFAGEQTRADIALSQINLIEQVGPCFIIAWNSFPAVVLPAELAHGLEAAALLRQIEEKRTTSL